MRSNVGFLTARARTSPRGVDLALWVTAQILVFKLGGAAGVFPQGVGRAVKEGVVSGPVEMLELADQVGLGKVYSSYACHVVVLWL